MRYGPIMFHPLSQLPLPSLSSNAECQIPLLTPLFLPLKKKSFSWWNFHIRSRPPMFAPLFPSHCTLLSFPSLPLPLLLQCEPLLVKEEDFCHHCYYSLRVWYSTVPTRKTWSLLQGACKWIPRDGSVQTWYTRWPNASHISKRNSLSISTGSLSHPCSLKWCVCLRCYLNDLE